MKNAALADGASFADFATAEFAQGRRDQRTVSCRNDTTFGQIAAPSVKRLRVIRDGTRRRD